MKVYKKIKVNEDLHIEIINLKHSNELYNLIIENKSFLSEWLPWVEHTETIDDTINFINNSISGYKAITSIQYIIYYKNNISGILGINDIKIRNRSVSIGYWLGEKFQGKGIVYLTLNKLIPVLFEKQCVERIEIRVNKNNIKSRNIPEKIGFKLEGVLRNAEIRFGRLEDVFLYGLIQSDYNKEI